MALLAGVLLSPCEATDELLVEVCAPKERRFGTAYFEMDEDEEGEEGGAIKVISEFISQVFG